MTTKRYGIKLRKCPVCGKDYVYSGLWKFTIKEPKKKAKPVCSYGCVRAFEKEREQSDRS